MAENKLTPNSSRPWCSTPAKRLGTTPEKLQRTVQQGGVADVAAGLPKEEAARLQEVLSDKKKAEALLNSPQAQKLMQQLFDNKKK